MTLTHCYSHSRLCVWEEIPQSSSQFTGFISLKNTFTLSFDYRFIRHPT